MPEALVLLVFVAAAVAVAVVVVVRGENCVPQRIARRMHVRRRQPSYL